ncbi:hypothetical protein [Streptomyces sp. NPDC005969]|uniref:hypothetical protein n=1 Tax=Streptomyces sp. NPDC005969 TaxID=3156722 RepID=UPI00340981AB
MLLTLASSDAPAPFVVPVSFTFCVTRSDSPHRSASRNRVIKFDARFDAGR